MPVNDFSKAGYSLCPEGRHTFTISFLEEKDGFAIFILKSREGNVFYRVPADPEDQFAWKTKELLEKAGFSSAGGFEWNALEGRTVIGWVVHNFSKKDQKTYANINTLAEDDADAYEKQGEARDKDGMPF